MGSYKVGQALLGAALAGGAKAYNDELEFRRREEAMFERDERTRAFQRELMAAQDEAAFNRMKRGAEFAENKEQSKRERYGTAFNAGLDAVREQGLDPNSPEALRIISRSFRDAGLPADAADIEKSAMAISREDRMAKRQDAILARQARYSGGDEKPVSLSKYMDNAEKDVAEAFRFKGADALGKTTEYDFHTQGGAVFRRLYNRALAGVEKPTEQDKRDAIDFASNHARDYAANVVERNVKTSGLGKDGGMDLFSEKALNGYYSRVFQQPAAEPPPAQAPAPERRGPLANTFRGGLLAPGNAPPPNMIPGVNYGTK